jgi:hypothetical protein
MLKASHDDTVTGAPDSWGSHGEQKPCAVVDSNKDKIDSDKSGQTQYHSFKRKSVKW